jgi:hypothetical protein
MKNRGGEKPETCLFGWPWKYGGQFASRRSAGLETRDTAGLETCATTLIGQLEAVASRAARERSGFQRVFACRCSIGLGGQ